MRQTQILVRFLLLYDSGLKYYLADAQTAPLKSWSITVFLPSPLAHPRFKNVRGSVSRGSGGRKSPRSQRVYTITKAIFSRILLQIFCIFNTTDKPTYHTKTALVLHGRSIHCNQIMHSRNNSSKFINLSTRNRLQLLCNEKLWLNFVCLNKKYVALVSLRTVFLTDVLQKHEPPRTPPVQKL